MFRDLSGCDRWLSCTRTHLHWSCMLIGSRCIVELSSKDVTVYVSHYWKLDETTPRSLGRAKGLIRHLGCFFMLGAVGLTVGASQHYAGRSNPQGCQVPCVCM